MGKPIKSSWSCSRMLLWSEGTGTSLLMKKPNWTQKRLTAFFLVFSTDLKLQNTMLPPTTLGERHYFCWKAYTVCGYKSLIWERHLQCISLHQIYFSVYIFDHINKICATHTVKFIRIQEKKENSLLYFISFWLFHTPFTFYIHQPFNSCRDLQALEVVQLVPKMRFTLQCFNTLTSTCRNLCASTAT